MAEFFACDFLSVSTVLLGLVVVMIVGYVLSTREIPGLPPGPSFLPLVGNVVDMSLTYRKRKHKYFEEMEKKFGPVYRLYFGRQLLILFNDVESVKEALVEKRDIFTDRPSEAFWVARQVQKGGSGIVWSNGQLWEYTHRMAVRGFQDLDIEEKVLAETENIIEEFSEFQNQPMKLNKILIRGTSNILSNVVFGKPFEYDDPEYIKILAFLVEAFKGEGPFTPFNMLPQLRYLPVLSAKYKELLSGAQYTVAYISKKVAEHKKTLNNKERPKNLIDYGLTAMADSKSKEFTDLVLTYSLLDLFLAGSDTAANALDWSFLYMILHPEVQMKCQREIYEVVGFGKRVKWADRPKLVYCAATLMEVQRLSNTAMTSLPRTATKDAHIKGYLIPKGCIILANTTSIHHNENLWEKPTEFKPERFIGGDGKIIHNSNFIPFSVGPRVCPGASLAKMELFLIFCNVLQSFSLSKAGYSKIDLDGILDTTLSPKPYSLLAKPRG